MTEKEYNAAEGIRRSDLWLMNDSPQKFRWHMDNPEDESEKSPSLIFGSAAHKYVLERNDFDNEYAVAPAINRLTKAGKEEWAQFLADNPGKTVITWKDFEQIHKMGIALLGCSLAVEMLTGQHEVPIFWEDPRTGVKCKCKMDVLRKINGRYVVVDYKTARSAQTEKFNNGLFSLGYHVQAAMYTEGLQTALRLDYRPDFCFVVQEKVAPYAVNVVQVSEDVMQYGDTVYHELLQRYHECSLVDFWPGYVDDVPNETTLAGWLTLGDDEE